MIVPVSRINAWGSMLANTRMIKTHFGVAASLLVVTTLTGCSSDGGSSASTAGDGAQQIVSISTFARNDPERSYLDAVKNEVRFEQRGGCLYVGEDQAVWFFGTTVRPKPGTTQFEVFDLKDRKLAETGTTVKWGGGQISAEEAASTRFADKLTMSSACEQRNENYWLVGKIQSPLFETDNYFPRKKSVD